MIVSDYILDGTITALFRNVNFDSAVLHGYSGKSIAINQKYPLPISRLLL